ncbi:Protein of unknown function (DUF4148) (plasmid) [Paraburkholderia caribensis MBA4]|uniref:Purine nucleoside phosphorylase n=1 Tax=Paraburkholderia caribensis MBA4 TaxID=1323664 RepID=A0A0P0RPB7_9BURK|nr:DUF4148 domain-containing protein [Paraburkholderia caribensis]ALL70721.1 Protein of unknown function (DUF4148) [Paraburkholderia caribensis MBA4]
MNIKIIAAFVVAAAISVPAFAATDAQAPDQQPVVAAAQSGGLTRAQVRADLVALQKAGYDQSRGEDVTYPTQIQAAEARVAAQKAAAGSQGGVGSGSEASGSRTAADRASIDGVKPAHFGQ